jgi:hypothetical protein
VRRCYKYKSSNHIVADCPYNSDKDEDEKKKHKKEKKEKKEKKKKKMTFTKKKGSGYVVTWDSDRTSNDDDCCWYKLTYTDKFARARIPL